jgi:hypothetical protein
VENVTEVAEVLTGCYTCSLILRAIMRMVGAIFVEISASLPNTTEMRIFACIISGSNRE